MGAAALLAACGGEVDTAPVESANPAWPGCDFGPPRAANDPYRLPCTPAALFCDGAEMFQCLVIEGCPAWSAVAGYASTEACQAALEDGPDSQSQRCGAVELNEYGNIVGRDYAECSGERRR